MAADLDRAYVINGDDLRIALGRCAWWFRDDGKREYIGTLKFPEEVADCVLTDVAKPLNGTPVTVEQLAEWFREREFATTGHMGDSTGMAARPELLAVCILEDITGQAHPMPGEAEIAESEPASLEDPELIAMQKISDALADLDDRAAGRVLAWACSKFSTDA